MNVAPTSRQRGLRPDIQKQLQVGLETTRGEFLHRLDKISWQTAATPLIRARRIGEPVCQDDRSAREAGTNHLTNELCAGRGEEKGLGFRKHVATGRAEQDATDAFADLGAPRFARGDHLASEAP